MLIVSLRKALKRCLHEMGKLKWETSSSNWDECVKQAQDALQACEIPVMGGAGPELADARPDASEAQGSAACAMEDAPPASTQQPVDISKRLRQIQAEMALAYQRKAAEEGNPGVSLLGMDAAFQVVKPYLRATERESVRGSETERQPLPGDSGDGHNDVYNSNKILQFKKPAPLLLSSQEKSNVMAKLVDLYKLMGASEERTSGLKDGLLVLLMKYDIYLRSKP